MRNAVNLAIGDEECSGSRDSFEVLLNQMVNVCFS